MLLILFKIILFLIVVVATIIVTLLSIERGFSLSAAFEKLRHFIQKIRPESLNTVTMAPYETIDDFLSDEEPKNGHTLWLPILFVDQLEPYTHKLLKRYKISDVPENGITISRPGANEGDIILTNATKVAYTVSQNHACIGKDSNGFFIQDQKSHNKMFADGKAKPVDEIPITDGLVVYLGMQPIRFVIPSFGAGDFRRNINGNNDSLTAIYGEKAPTTYRDKPVRRRTV